MTNIEKALEPTKNNTVEVKILVSVDGPVTQHLMDHLGQIFEVAYQDLSADGELTPSTAEYDLTTINLDSIECLIHHTTESLNSVIDSDLRSGLKETILNGVIPDLEDDEIIDSIGCPVDWLKFRSLVSNGIFIEPDSDMFATTLCKSPSYSLSTAAEYATDDAFKDYVRNRFQSLYEPIFEAAETFNDLICVEQNGINDVSTGNERQQESAFELALVAGWDAEDDAEWQEFSLKASPLDIATEGLKYLAKRLL